MVSNPFAFVNPAIKPMRYAFALDFVFPELTFVNTTIRPEVFAQAMKLIVEPLASICISVVKFHGAKPVAYAV